MSEQNDGNGMHKVILLFGFDDLPGMQQAFALQELTSRMGVLVRRVGKASYSQTMLSILRQAAAGTEEEEARTGGKNERPLPAKMMVFAAFSDAELYQALDLCPPCGITKEVLKASLTPANSRWNAFRLCENIMEEHRRIRDLQRS